MRRQKGFHWTIAKASGTANETENSTKNQTETFAATTAAAVAVAEMIVADAIVAEDETRQYRCANAKVWSASYSHCRLREALGIFVAAHRAIVIANVNATATEIVT